ncbi:RNA-splicing factor [Lecanicillium sp. MT-2017a]|nr:RNA-splicing factor [Lecanicillium sp. MT-2017a]
MSDNVGLSTPRGSGTSGYVQRNLAHIKPRDHAAPYPKDKDMRRQQRQPDKGILEHDRKREIEVKVFDLRDQLEEEEVDEDEIEDRCDALRKKLLAEMNSGKKSDVPRRQFKQHQVHAMADAKIKESERLRRALKISSDYEEGDHWRKQEERLKESVPRVDEKKEDEPRARDDDSRDDGSRDDDSRDDEDGEEKEEGEVKDSRD